MPLYNVGTGVTLPDLIYHDTENDTWEDSNGNDLGLSYFDYDENYTGEVDGVSGDTVSIAIVQPTSWDEELDEPSAEHKVLALGSILYESTGPNPLTLAFDAGPNEGTVRVYVEGEYGEEDMLGATTVTPVDINVGDEYTAEEFTALMEQYEFQPYTSEQNVITANIGDQVTVVSYAVEGDPETDPENVKAVITNKGEAEIPDYTLLSVSMSQDDPESPDWWTIEVEPELKEGLTRKENRTLLSAGPAEVAVGDDISSWDAFDNSYDGDRGTYNNWITVADADADGKAVRSGYVCTYDYSPDYSDLTKFVLLLNVEDKGTKLGSYAESGTDINITPNSQISQILQAEEAGQGSAVQQYWLQVKAQIVALSSKAADQVEVDPALNLLYNNQTVFTAKAGQITYNKYD